MKWRFVDRIILFVPWLELRTEKAVSLEEYYLRERIGQPGEFPESLMLESCVQSAQWLIAASSSFTQSGIIESIPEFAIKRTLYPGEKSDIVVTVNKKEKSIVYLSCRILVNDEELAVGNFSILLCPLNELDCAAERKSLWLELLRIKEVK